MEAMIGLLQDGVGLGTSFAQLPSVTLQRAIQVGLKGAELSRQLGNLQRDIQELQKLPYDDALDFLTFQSDRFTTTHSADAAQEQAVATVTALQGQALPDVIAEVRPPEGTDLRDLALQYYGDPDLWYIIAQFNGLEGSAVPANPTGPSDNPAPALQIPRRIEGVLGQPDC
jgi:hypothetical protein